MKMELTADVKHLFNNGTGRDWLRSTKTEKVQFCLMVAEVGISQGIFNSDKAAQLTRPEMATQLYNFYETAIEAGTPTDHQTLSEMGGIGAALMGWVE